MLESTRYSHSSAQSSKMMLESILYQFLNFLLQKAGCSLFKRTAGSSVYQKVNTVSQLDGSSTIVHNLFFQVRTPNARSSLKKVTLCQSTHVEQTELLKDVEEINPVAN